MKFLDDFCIALTIYLLKKYFTVFIPLLGAFCIVIGSILSIFLLAFEKFKTFSWYFAWKTWHYVVVAVAVMSIIGSNDVHYWSLELIQRNRNSTNIYHLYIYNEMFFCLCSKKYSFQDNRKFFCLKQLIFLLLNDLERNSQLFQNCPKKGNDEKEQKEKGKQALLVLFFFFF